MKVIFMGTPDFAVESLIKIHASQHEVVAVITAPDKPAGRGKKLSSSAVKKKAEELGLPVLQPTNLKDEGFLEDLKSYQADLFVVVAFRMLPKVVWDMPTQGTINLHASLLPNYRGAAPINWAIINGEEETGVTTFFIREKIDTGDIILQEKCSIAPTDNAGVLHDKLMKIGGKLVVTTLDKLETDTYERIPQDKLIEGKSKEAPKIFRETCKVDWNKNTQDVYNLIRGLSPYPAAWSKVIDMNGKEKQLKLYAAEHTEEAPTLAPGEIIIENGRFFAGCKDGVLAITELQMEGKKRMDCKSFLLGCQLEDRCRFID